MRRLKPKTTVPSSARRSTSPPNLKGKDKCEAQSTTPQEDAELSSSEVEGEEQDVAEDPLESEEEATQK